MLTVYTSTYCRPDYVQLLAYALQRTLIEPYRFIVVVHPNGLKREWYGVDEIIDGVTSGYEAWKEVLEIMNGPSVIMHDDLVPVMPWSSASFSGSNVTRFSGQTLHYHANKIDTMRVNHPTPSIKAKRINTLADCPDKWSSKLCKAAVDSKVEVMLNGIFLHIDKGTIFNPKTGINTTKTHLVEAIAEYLGCDVPSPLQPEELLIHPGR